MQNMVGRKVKFEGKTLEVVHQSFSAYDGTTLYLLDREIPSNRSIAGKSFNWSVSPESVGIREYLSNPEPAYTWL